MVSKPPENSFQKTGYKFKQWNNNGNEFNFNTPINSDITLNAVWDKEYDVVLDPNGGTFESGFESRFQTTVNSYNLADAESKLTYSGYKLLGWKDGITDTLIDPSSVISLSQHCEDSDVQLTAQWVKVYTVRFYTDGAGTIPDQVIEYGGKVSKPADPIKTDYTFMGWFTAPPKVTYDFTAEVYSDLVINADWVTTRSLQAEVKFYSSIQGAANLTDTKLIGKGDMITGPQIEAPAGMTFAGWFKITRMSSPTDYDIEDNPFNFNNPINDDLMLITKMVPNKYIIHFDLNGGSGAIADKAVTTLDHHIPINSSGVSRQGYNLDGWTLNTRDSTVFTDYIEDPLTLENNEIVTLYAKWSKIHTVSFDSAGGTAVSSQSVINGNKASMPADPTRVDYTFKYWYQSGSPNVQYNFDSAVTSDTKLVARWDATGTHTVEFRSGLGQVMVIQDVLVGQKATKPTDIPTRPGYTFNGWCLSTNPSQQYDFNTPVTQDLVILVIWEENQYRIHFDLNGGQASPAPGDIQVMATGSCEMPSGTYTKEGYKFVGWTKVQDGTETPLIGTISASAFYLGPMEVTLYASWEKMMMVKFDPMDGVNQPTVKYVEKGQKTDATGVAIASTRAHYTFKQWQLVSSSQEFDFVNTPIESDVNLFAYWQADNSYVVEFYKKFKDGTEVLAGSQTVYHGDKAIKPVDPTAEGMKFTGWVNTDGNPFDFNTPIKTNVKLTASWVPVMYTIHFDLNGGPGEMQDMVVPVLAQGIKLDNSSVKWLGHRFLGWNTEQDGSGTLYMDVITEPLANEETRVTLYAQWKVLHTYTVNFDSHGGTSVPSQSVYEGDLATRPSNPTKQSFIFGGWYVDSGFTALYDFSVPVTSNITLHAKWNSPSISYTVTFDTNGGTPVGPKRVSDGDTVSEPKTTREGYVFEGWYKDVGLTKKYDFSTPVHSDMTLYAKWTIVLYHTVTFDTNGGSSVPSQRIIDGGHAVRPEDPSKEGFSFTGWYSDAALKTPFYFENPIHSDVTLYAAWKEHVDPPVPEPEKDNTMYVVVASILLIILVIAIVVYVYSKRRI